MNPKPLTLLAAALLTALSTNAPAQKVRAPLQMYNAAGQALGQYIGWACYSTSLSDAPRLDVCWQPLPEYSTVPAWFEATDCSGTAYTHAQNPTIRSGQLFTTGLLFYPSGTTRAVTPTSFRYADANGTYIGDCYTWTAGEFPAAAELKSINVGPGPYTVK